MLTRLEVGEVFQALFEDRPVYMMTRIDKTNAIEDMFGADAFYTEQEQEEEEEACYVTEEEPEQPEEELSVEAEILLKSKQGRPSADRDAIKCLYLKGKNQKDIAKQLGYGYSTVNRYISEMISNGEV